MRESDASLLEAAETLAAIGIEDCPSCGGTGKEYEYENGEADACIRCGGYGEIASSDPTPEEIRQARAAVARAECK